MYFMALWVSIDSCIYLQPNVSNQYVSFCIVTCYYKNIYYYTYVKIILFIIVHYETV